MGSGSVINSSPYIHIYIILKLTCQDANGFANIAYL